jgi:hypothetical protein
VIERRERRDAGLYELVHEPVVKVESFDVRRARPLRKDARPGDRETVRVRTDGPHERDVLFIAVVVIVGDVTGVVVLDVACLVRVRVPDRRAFAILVPRALDLVRRSRCAP